MFDIRFRKRRLKQIHLILKVVTILSVLAIAFFIYQTENREHANSNVDMLRLSDGWEQVVGDERIPIGNIIDAQLGESKLIFERELPIMDADDILLFYTEHREVEAYVDDELIYSFRMQDELKCFDTPGNTWNEVRMNPEMIGKTIRLELDCKMEAYEKEVYGVYLLNEGGKGLVQFDRVYLQTIAAILICVVSVLLYGSAFVWKQKTKRKYIYLLADLYLCVGVWLLTKNSYVDINIGKPVFSYFVSMITLRMIPLVFASYIKTNLGTESKVMQIFRICTWINLLGSIVLQFVFDISFGQTLLVNNLVIVAGLVAIAAEFVRMAIRNRKEGRQQEQILNSGVLLLGTSVDLVGFFFIENYSVGTAACIALILYSVINFATYIFQRCTLDIEKEQMQNELERLQNSILQKQINSHFMYNTLNTISALCKQDAREADRAVKLFAKYMRSNMYLIGQQGLIPFKKEMELVETYLEIEKIRFGDSIQVFIELQAEEFEIPALTLQPIVENAIVHGLRGRTEGGAIWLRTRALENGVAVDIIDNGVGFEMKALEKGDSLGFNNIKRRIEYLTNGIVTVESVVCEGTMVNIYLPQRDKDVWKEGSL